MTREAAFHKVVTEPVLKKEIVFSVSKRHCGKGWLFYHLVRPETTSADRPQQPSDCTWRSIVLLSGWSHCSRSATAAEDLSRPAGMWSHVRLLRRALLLVSVPTLSGLHLSQQRLPAVWRAARLLPITLSVALSGAGAARIVSASPATLVMFYLTLGALTFHGLVVLLHLLRRRCRLHELLRRAAGLLDATEISREVDDIRVFAWQTGLLAAATGVPVLFWWVRFLWFDQLSQLQFGGPPEPLLPVLAPTALSYPPWNGAVFGLQLVHLNMAAALVILFDILLAGLTDAVAVLLMRLGRFARDHLSDELSEGCRNGNADEQVVWHSDVFHVSGRTAEKAGEATRPVPVHNRGESRHTLFVRSNEIDPPARDETKSPVPLPVQIRSPAAASVPAPLQRHGDLEHRLRLLSGTFGQVRRLAGDAADLCSLPTLSLHAWATTALLAGIYISIRLSLDYWDTASHIAESAGLALFLPTLALRLLVISSAGSRLTRHQQQLHAQLAAVSWPAAAASTAARFQLQLLLELTREEITFHGWGLFSTQKGTLVSLLGFVLTYVVILVQMNVD